MSRAAAATSPHGDLILGRYRAIRPLGSGGSGSVWLARDVIDDRDVALKVVPREGNAGERAEREAQAVAQLRDRRCVRAYRVERDERHVYVAYEYVAGQTLRKSIRDGALDDAGAVETSAQVLDALSHAHHRGIIHRDVKPANILLEDGDDVSARLLDFGLAQFGEVDPLTATGDVPGTLAYISPERLAGRQASGAADVWAVGVILWESLAGFQPFFTASPVETARLIGSGAPSLASERPDLPKRLISAVDRALAVDPRRRPDARVLAAELRRSIAETRSRRARRPVSSRRVVAERAVHAGLAGAVTAAVCLALPFFPTPVTVALASLAALLALLEPRAGLALALAAPILPLGNISLGLALAYVPVALGWMAIFWRDARHGLLFATGPVLSLFGGLALVPLVAERASGTIRRALQGGGAVILSALVAGFRGLPLPFTGEQPPLGLGIAGSESTRAVAGALWRALEAHPTIAIEAGVFAVASALLPIARRHGLPGVAIYDASVLAASVAGPSLLGAGMVEPVPLVLGSLVVCAVAAAPALRGSLVERRRAAAYNEAR